MKKILLGLLFAGLASTALATTVTFSTNNAVFGCGSIVSGCSFTNGTTTSSLDSRGFDPDLYGQHGLP
ncbi:MAG: hypothetical protein WDO18_03935 [Acidobacteriota bacterium]